MTKSRYIGIGRQIAVSFAREGCSKVAILDQNKEGLEETIRLCKDANPAVEIHKEVYDARDEKQVNASISAAYKAFGRIDYAVNSAGS